MTREHPFAYLKHRADLKRCCHNEKNLRVVQRAFKTIVGVCVVCGRKHRKMTAEPGTIFAKSLQAMGRPLLRFPHRKVLAVL